MSPAYQYSENTGYFTAGSLKYFNYQELQYL